MVLNTKKPRRLLQSSDEPMKLLESCKKHIKIPGNGDSIKTLIVSYHGCTKKDLKIGFRIISIMVFTSKKNTINTKEYYFT